MSASSAPSPAPVPPPTADRGATAVPGPTAAPEPTVGGGPVPPEERGSTVVSDRAVERLACAAAGEHRSTRPLGDRFGGLVGDGRAARVEVRRGGSRVSLRLEVAVAYPSPLARTAEEVREHVTTVVERLTGLTVHSTDIQIVRLVPAPRVR